MVLAMVTTLLAASAAAATAPAPPRSRHFLTRNERCNLLDRQLETVLRTNRTARHAFAARALRSKAERLCRTHRQAQGIRTYADALNLLGVRPFDDRRVQRKPVPNSKETHR